MDSVYFKQIIDTLGGEEKVLGFVFDNAGKYVFTTNKFTYAEHLKEAINSLVFKETDIKGNTYLVVKPLDNVQTILMADGTTNTNEYDRRSLGL